MKKLMIPGLDHSRVIKITIFLTMLAIVITNESQAEHISSNKSEQEIYPLYNTSAISLETQENKSSKSIMQDLSSPLSYWFPSLVVNRLSGRTFGAVKRLQQAFLPLFFKLGVIITLLVFLTIMVSKTMFIGLSLLALNFSAFFAKFFMGKEQYSAWHQQPHSGWHQPSPIIKNIHVHVHKPDASMDHLSSHYYQPQLLNYHDRLSDYSGYHVPTTNYDQSTGLNQNNLSPEEKNYISKIISKLAK